VFRPLALESRVVNDDTSASSTQITRLLQHKSIDDFHPKGLIQRWNVSLATMVAFAAIILLPSPSVASVEQVQSLLVDGGIFSTSVVISSENLSSITPRSISELGLKPPTEEKPQILLNGKVPGGPPAQRTMSRQTDIRKPILQGLVYFPERASNDPAAVSPAGPQVKQQLDYYSDVLVLTAVSAAQPDGPVLAGAKFPVSSVRFPFSFQMYKENLLAGRPGVQAAWDSLADTGDVLLRANICPIDTSALPCDDNDVRKHAEGIAKIITDLPGLKEGQVIRAPASLALQ